LQGSGEGTYGQVKEDHEPGAMSWILALALFVGVLGGLVHVYHVLRGNDSLGLGIRNVPDGMHPVECGACHAMQYIHTHGRIFVCYSCHLANRLPIEFPRMEETRLVAATGPLRRYEFRKGRSNNFWQELRQDQVQQGDCSSAFLQVNAEPDGGGNPSAAGTPAAPVGIRVIGENPCVLGRQSDVDDEVISCATNDGSGIPRCVVCLDMPGNMVLLPCAHGSVCEECVTRIVQNRASGGSHCPHCRSNIQVLVKIHEVEGEFAKGLELRIPMARPL
jgi:hypothetical protein